MKKVPPSDIKYNTESANFHFSFTIFNKNLESTVQELQPYLYTVTYFKATS